MTPDNGSFMVAAYVVLGVLYGAYAVWVLGKGREGR
jgi:hypothetical protein